MKTKEMQQGTMRCMLCPCHLREKSKVNGWSKKNPKTAVKGIKHKKKRISQPPQLSWQRTKVHGDDDDDDEWLLEIRIRVHRIANRRSSGCAG